LKRTGGPAGPLPGFSLKEKNEGQKMSVSLGGRGGQCEHNRKKRGERRGREGNLTVGDEICVPWPNRTKRPGEAGKKGGHAQCIRLGTVSNGDPSKKPDRRSMGEKVVRKGVKGTGSTGGKRNGERLGHAGIGWSNGQRGGRVFWSIGR